MLGVEDQRDVHHLHVQLAGLLAVEQGEEVPADGRLVAVAVDALAFVGEAVPVGHDRREGGEQAVGDVALLVEAQLRFQGAEDRGASAHHVHRVGVLGNPFENFLQRLRQVALALELLQVGVELLLVRQFAVEQQIGDFLEDRRRRQVADVVATVGQAGAFLADGGQGCLTGHLATQAGATQYFCFSHCSLLS